MKKTVKSSVLIFSTVLFCLTSCEKQKNISSSVFHNPVAKAGPDTTVQFPANTLTLDGSSSFDQDNNITAFRWSKVSGPPSIKIASPQSAKTLVSDLLPGDYFVELEVTDNTNLVGKDTIKISVAPIPSPPPGSRVVKAKVLEYGTNMPLWGAAIMICFSPTGSGSCSGNYSRFITDASGSCRFTADSFRYGWTEYAGYWQSFFDPCFVSYFRNDSLLREDFLTADSFVVKIVPKSTVSIHIKDSSGTVAGRNISLVGDVDFNCVSSQGIIAANLRPGIDTTIVISNLYGNANYLIRAGKNYEADCHCYETEFYRQVKYMGKGDSTIWNIRF